MHGRYAEAPTLLSTPPCWEALVGQRFGRLTVLGFSGAKTKFKQSLLTCRCDCGYFVDVLPHGLRVGTTSSCGCLHAEELAARNVARAKHGAASGGKVTYLYRVWQSIKNRCLKPKNAVYADYGGRGITVHAPWISSFVRFRDDLIHEIGERPTRAHSLDRVDNDRGYAPGNLRWATPVQQNRNTRTNQRYEMDGDLLTLAEWSERFGASYNLVQQRVHKFGWGLREALLRPSGDKGTSKEERKRLKAVWHAMVGRCHDPTNRRYKDYGARGVRVHDAWRNSFRTFLADLHVEIGERPSTQHSLDRINNARGYEPGNVRWATSTEQNRNRRTAKLYELNGQRRPLAEWAALAGMRYDTVKGRILGFKWPLDEALGTPVGFGRCPKGTRRKWSPDA